jgi:hypothetical protein
VLGERGADPEDAGLHRAGLRSVARNVRLTSPFSTDPGPHSW